MEDNANFAQNLKKYMYELDLVQSDIAQITESAQSSVSEWLSGKKLPRMGKVQRLADRFGTTCNKLLGSDSPDQNKLQHAGAAISNGNVEIKDIAEYAELLEINPSIKYLIATSKDSTDEDIKDIVKIIQNLKGK